MSPSRRDALGESGGRSTDQRGAGAQIKGTTVVHKRTCAPSSAHAGACARNVGCAATDMNAHSLETGGRKRRGQSGWERGRGRVAEQEKGGEVGKERAFLRRARTCCGVCKLSSSLKSPKSVQVKEQSAFGSAISITCQTDGQRDRYTGRSAGRQAGRQGGRQAGRQGGSEAGSEAARQRGRQAGRQGGREAGRQADGQASRQAGRHKGIKAGRGEREGVEKGWEREGKGEEGKERRDGERRGRRKRKKGRREGGREKNAAMLSLSRGIVETRIQHLPGLTGC
eukprot:6212340-Pleurochrysis_carterae.AAC.1